MVAAATPNPVDHLFNATRESVSFTVFVQYQARWVRGCQFDTLEAAMAQASESFRRSGLSVEVRDAAGIVRFRQNATSRVACGV